MKLLVGLGNPGEKYSNTRHNIGFILVERLASDLEISFGFDSKFNAEVAKKGDLILCKPQTYMNKSGLSVSKIASYYKVDPKDIYVVHDEVDLGFGDIKIQCGAGSAGHRGVQDIIDALGTKEFWRFRIGVGRPADPNFATEDWVLSKLDQSEINELLSYTQEIKKRVGILF